MREIKFRAWFDGHMYEVAKLDFWGDPEQATCDMAGLGENGEGEELFDIYAGEVELMQYTGLKDKNGVEIYEGDIVRGRIYHMFYEDNVVFQIGWIDEENGYGLHWFPKEVEVIGNIFENPELLGETH